MEHGLDCGAGPLQPWEPLRAWQQGAPQPQVAATQLLAHGWTDGQKNRPAGHYFGRSSKDIQKGCLLPFKRLVGFLYFFSPEGWRGREEVNFIRSSQLLQGNWTQ